MTEQETPQGSTPRPIPDLGFFAGPAKPRGGISSFGGAPAQPPSSSPAPSRFSTPSVNQFGTAPTAPFGPPAQVYGPGGYPPQPYGPPKRGGLPVWAIVAICVPTVFIAIGILAAIAIPVFLSQRDEAVASSTSVSLPTQIAGLNASTDEATQQKIQSMLNAVPVCKCSDRPVASVFSNADGSHVVVAGAAKVNGGFHATDRDDFVRGFWDSARSSSGGAVGAAHDQTAGKLGGTMSCAPISGIASGNVCVAVDAGSYFFVFDTYRTGSVDQDLPRTAREAFVHRR